MEINKKIMIDLSNIEGIEMVVYNFDDKCFIRKIIAHIDNEVFIDSYGDSWSNAKPILNK